MQAEMPFFEGPEDALRSAVQSLGGAKQVGAMLWPDKTPDSAGRLLLDCLNPARAEKLDISQVMLILSKAKERGVHAPFAWLAGEIGYDARPIAREEEADRLATALTDATKQLAAVMAKAEALQRMQIVRAA